MAQLQMFCDTSFSDTTYIGLIGYYLRDYIQGTLTSRLILGQMYCVSFYVVLEHLSAFSINHIGAYFDDGTIDTANFCSMPQTMHIPQVYETDIISDTLNWTKVQGVFTATGTERFITIGNFFDSAHTNKIPTNFYWAIGMSNTYYTWYLIDDVSVIPLNAAANAGIDRITSPTGDSVWVGDTTGYLPCYWYANGVLIDSNIAGFKVHPDTTTHYVMVLDVCGNITTDTAVVWVSPTGVRGVGSGEQGLLVVVYPNPAGNEINIDGAENCDIKIYNMFGEVVEQLPCNPSPKKTSTISIKDLPTGVYYIAITDVLTGEKVVKRVVKE